MIGKLTGIVDSITEDAVILDISHTVPVLLAEAARSLVPAP